MTIAPRTGVSARPHRVSFENPGPSVPDGDGGYTPGPPVTIGFAYVALAPATGADQERVGAGVILSRRSYVVSAPYITGVTTESVMRFADPRAADVRLFTVMSVTSADDLGAEVTLVCDEIVR